jgi:propionate CoA-transferase
MSAAGRHPKFVDKVDQVSFSARRALAKGQEVYLASEHYLLRFVDRGWTVADVDDDAVAHGALEQIRFALAH